MRLWRRALYCTRRCGRGFDVYYQWLFISRQESACCARALDAPQLSHAPGAAPVWTIPHTSQTQRWMEGRVASKRIASDTAASLFWIVLPVIFVRCAIMIAS